MEKTGKFVPTSAEIGILSWSVIMFLTYTLRLYTHWEFRTCSILSALPIWVAQGLFFKTPPKKMAIQVLASVAIVYFGWALLNRVWK